MEQRTALEKDTVLKCRDNSLSYTIQKEIARGGSCIVYDAVYQTDFGEEKPIRLKECYPFELNIRRTKTGEVIPGGGDKEKFEEAKDNMRRAFRKGNGLFLTEGLTNSMTNMLRCFDQNNTVYIPSVYLEGGTLTYHTFSNMKDCIRIVRSVSQVVAGIHKAGYLYLDMKPDNVFVLKNTAGGSATELVQLFDFDSLVRIKSLKEKNMSGCRFSYTKGFAPLEHQMGQFHKFGFYTDVYGIGALLFYLIFGNPPRAAECVSDAEYCFERSKYGNISYQDKLFVKLSDFFHKTLANYRFDRYQTMGEVVERLNELSGLANTAIPYVCSAIVPQNRYFVGRCHELMVLEEWFGQGASQCFFLTGIGGIGKSSLAREFVSANAIEFDTMLYLYYRDSIQHLLIDDVGLQINTAKQEPAESDSDYFIRKLRILSRILAQKKALLVIDNFSGEITEEFLQMLRVGWKVLVISRDKPPSDNGAQLRLEALQKPSQLYHLFENYSGLKLKDDEKRYLDHIISKSDGHTLILELIARQIKSSRITIAEAETLVEKSGFSNMSSEKIRFEKDSRTGRETIKNIISVVFPYHGQDQEKKRILKALSLFAQPGVELDIFSEMMELASMDPVNELEEEGWITCSDTMLSMHPVIREVVGGWEWKDRYLADAGHITEFLYVRLRTEAERAEFPLPYLKINGYLNSVFEKDSKTGDWLEKQAHKKGMIGEVWKKRVSQGGAQKATDHRKVKQILQLAESVLDESRKTEALGKLDICIELAGYVLLHMPVDREEYIIRHTEELIHEPACRNRYVITTLYHKLISVYLEQRALGKAWELIEAMKSFARDSNQHIKAEYYDMLADFYDTRLDGQYEHDNEYCDLGKLMKAIDRSIFHMKLARDGRKEILLTQYMLNKANVLMRSTPKNKKGIVRLLEQAGRKIEKNAQKYSGLRWEYAMSVAWYYTLIVPDEIQAVKYCSIADDIVGKTCATELEHIDIIVIPYANMMTELGNLEKAQELLRSGIKTCGKYQEILPYARKKMELYQYLLEVCYYSGDEDACRKVMESMEAEDK